MYDPNEIDEMADAAMIQGMHDHAVSRFAELHAFKLFYDHQTIRNKEWWRYEDDSDNAAYMSIDEASELIENSFFDVTKQDDIDGGLIDPSDPRISQFADESVWIEYVKDSLWNYGYINLPYPLATACGDVCFYPTLINKDGIRVHEPSPIELCFELACVALGQQKEIGMMPSNQLTEKEAWQKYADYCQHKTEESTSAHELLYYQGELNKAKQELGFA